MDLRALTIIFGVLFSACVLTYVFTYKSAVVDNSGDYNLLSNANLSNVTLKLDSDTNMCNDIHIGSSIIEISSPADKKMFFGCYFDECNFNLTCNEVMQLSDYSIFHKCSFKSDINTDTNAVETIIINYDGPGATISGNTITEIKEDRDVK